MLQDEEFKKLITDPNSELGIEVIKFAVRRNIYLGTRSYVTFLGCLRHMAPNDIKNNIKIIALPIKSYVSVIASIKYPLIQAYLDSDEFRAIPPEDRLASLVTKILEFKLPLDSENLSHIYTALPHRLSEKVFNPM